MKNIAKSIPLAPAKRREFKSVCTRGRKNVFLAFKKHKRIICCVGGMLAFAGQAVASVVAPPATNNVAPLASVTWSSSTAYRGATDMLVSDGVPGQASFGDTAHFVFGSVTDAVYSIDLAWTQPRHLSCLQAYVCHGGSAFPDADRTVSTIEFFVDQGSGLQSVGTVNTTDTNDLGCFDLTKLDGDWTGVTAVRYRFVQSGALPPRVAEVLALGGPDTTYMARAGAWLRGKAKDLVRNSARPMTDGSGRTAFIPQAGGGYDAFWLRDYEYMLEGAASAFSTQELTDAAVLFVDSLRADGAGVDKVRLDGTPSYIIGIGDSNPVADGSQFTVSVVWQTFQRLADTALLERNVDGEPLVERLVATMNAVPRSTNGLVFIDPSLAHDRAPYGFTDTVREEGEVLFCSLLDVQASRQLGDLLEASGRTTAAAAWRAHADAAAATIRSTFWDAQVGLFRAATVQCREHDIWGSAFAVHLGVATETQADDVARYFHDHYAEIVQAGQIRHLPGGTYWEATATARNTYQNGAFWATATGWFAETLARIDQSLADSTILAMIDDFRARGVNEWVSGSMIGVSAYTANATLPLAIMAEMYDIPTLATPGQVGGIMSAGNVALVSSGAVAFARNVINGYSQHAISHLNDGLYGNDHSWVAGSAGSFAGVAFNAPRTISSIAFGRDNGGETIQFTDRFAGLYLLQITHAPNPDAATPDDQWTTVAYAFSGQLVPDATGYLRHRYDFDPINDVTGVRILVSADGAPVAIDELEAYSPAPRLELRLELFNGGSMLRFAWNGTSGKLYDLCQSSKLDVAFANWTPVATNLVASPLEIPRPPDPAMFYILKEKDAP